MLSLLLLALAVPMSAVLLAAAAPALSAHSVALEAKYLVGRCIAFVALLAIAPILIGLTLAVRLTSRGPVLFRQRRVGQDGELFEMLKFRSMRVADAAGFVPVAGAAPGGVEGVDRRTPIGRFIRRTSLDELPQLWNVVRGDMCLVGPRPERPEHVERFSVDVPGYGNRHRVRVGLTGLAQVNGSRGASCIATRAEMDNAYIDGWSLGLDIRILGRTAGAVLRGAE
ncbi:UDP-glucose:undecaprenyl-phosphate glucose-1-phosphate transferase [Baekduia alba]|uniref:sugar transferase n=1 Tax=Baekduia alba TaxID=2997333 RepID=UPI0023412691|nr:sugar transferase [Baekduia alba]WCB96923.1 UDP-glucose:undecaprenyl-phosphate glucose-1-phosphate transferase [Baekduia alba]